MAIKKSSTTNQTPIINGTKQVAPEPPAIDSSASMKNNTGTSNPTNNKRVYSLLPDLPDHTAPVYVSSNVKLPNDISWQSSYPEVYNQLDTNSCTAQAMCGAVSFLNKDFSPSQLFQFYNERVLLNTVNSDAGATLSVACKAAENNGICPENLWPFNISQLTVRPEQICYSKAIKNLFSKSSKLLTQNNPNLIAEIKDAIAQGHPVIAGILVFPSMEDQGTAETGIVPMPSGNNPPLGGHAIVLMGYYEATGLIQFRNSWGPNWGKDGYGFLPEAYFESYLMSAWVLEK